jgi:hypothetical protein
MQTASAMVPYFGPRPSPARRVAPWVIAGAVALALSNLALLVLNLIERRLQQRRTSVHPASPKQIHDTLTRIHTVSGVATAVVVAYAVVAVIWEVKRRSRARVAQYGEAGVEARLRVVWRRGYAVFIAMIAGSILLSFLTTQVRHSATTIDDIVRYRSYVAAGHAVRIVMWIWLVVLVDRSTQYQERREAASAPIPISE